jgi:outer membrane protein assembly factor BamB
MNHHSTPSIDRSCSSRNQTARHGLLSFIVAWFVTSPLMSLAEDWTRFQDVVGASGSAIPVTWTATENRLWATELSGYGQSSPVTWNGQVYVTTVSGSMKERCHVEAFDLSSGKRLWQVEVLSATQAENNNYISRAAPSPTVDSLGVYCFFEGGNLIALSHQGEVRWQRNLVKEYGEIQSRHGLSASLEQTVDNLFVWVERQADPYVLCVNKTTGLDVWKIPGVEATSWSSPRLLSVDGGQHLLLSASGSVTGLDPKSGQLLWKLNGVTGNSSPTPIPAGTGRFLLGATVGRGEADSGNAAASNGLVEVRRTDAGTYQADYIWRAKRATSSFGSPSLHRGMAYFVNASGVLYGLDLETGEERYTQRLSDSMWATPVSLGDRLAFCGKGGTVTVVAAGSEFKKLAENSTWDAPADSAEATPQGARGGPSGPVLYAVAVSGDRLLLRRGDRLYCIGNSAAASIR